MQGAEIEDEGSVLTYMTKSEIEGQRSCLLIMPQRLFDRWVNYAIVDPKKAPDMAESMVMTARIITLQMFLVGIGEVFSINR